MIRISAFFRIITITILSICLPTYLSFKVSLLPVASRLPIEYPLLMAINYFLASYLIGNLRYVLFSISLSYIISSIIATMLAKYPLELFFSPLSAELALWSYILRNITFFSVIMSLPISLLAIFIGLYVYSSTEMRSTRLPTLIISILMLLIASTSIISLAVDYNTYFQNMHSISRMEITILNCNVTENQVLFSLTIHNHGSGRIYLQTLVYDLYSGNKLINSTLEDFSYKPLVIESNSFIERDLKLRVSSKYASLLHSKRLALKVWVFVKTPFGLHRRTLTFQLKAS